MSIYRKKEDISKHLPQAFYLFVVETDLAANQFSYCLGAIKALTTHVNRILFRWISACA